MRIYLMALFITLMTACASESERAASTGLSGGAASSEILNCPPPSPAGAGDVCAAIYDPVCASVNGIEKTFSNSCRACSAATVNGYKKGACE